MRLGKPAEAAPDENSNAPPDAGLLTRSSLTGWGTVCAGPRLLEMKSSHKVTIPMKASPKPQQKTILRAVEAQPHLDLDKGQETQPWGTLTDLPISLSEETRMQSVEALNQLLADTISLRDMYKKHHWQVSGPTFYQLHLLFDAHYEEQAELVDTIAERIMSLGGVSVAMAHDVAETTMIRRPPKGRETPAMQITRLVEAHRQILAGSRKAAKAADEAGDDGTNDLFVSDVIRTNEKQLWFIVEHLVAARLE
jgi:starvation-inducible DNA-binding protein